MDTKNTPKKKKEVKYNYRRIKRKWTIKVTLPNNLTRCKLAVKKAFSLLLHSYFKAKTKSNNH